MSDVKDGTATTIMLAERLIADGDNGTNSLSDQVKGNARPGSVSYTFPSAAGVEAWGQAAEAGWSNQNSGGCHNQFWHHAGMYINQCATPNWNYPDVQTGNCGWYGHGERICPPRSEHPGGVNVALGDASVRFITNDVEHDLWQALGSRAGKEAVTLP